MSNFKTKYMGLELKNPIIVGASSLTANLNKIKDIEEAGAGAIVAKSLFEEQIQLERYRDELDREEANHKHAEMITVFPDKDQIGIQEHLYWLRKTKEAVDIPVIGSLNAVNRDTWLEYAQQIADTGVDGLELNFYSSPKSFDKTASQIEDEQIDILKELTSKIKIPISVKLSNEYTNPLNMIKKMNDTGIAGFVIFNRYFQPDLNIDKLSHTFPFNLSKPQDNRYTLRYTGLVSGNISANICSSGGIFNASDVIKMILAGADSVQMVSALYRHGIGHIAKVLNDLDTWMKDKGFTSLADFKGKLSKANSNDPWAYTRAQYAKLLMKPELLRKDKSQI